MKNKIIKVSLFVFIGLFIFTSGVVAAKLTARDVSFNPDNTSWNVENVEEAINDLYSNSNKPIKIPKLLFQLYGSVGGAQFVSINTENYNTLKIGSRAYDYKCGTTYYYIDGFYDENCSIDPHKTLLKTNEPSNGVETYDISEFKCVKLYVGIDVAGEAKWSNYTFNNIEISK